MIVTFILIFVGCAKYKQENYLRWHNETRLENQKDFPHYNQWYHQKAKQKEEH